MTAFGVSERLQQVRHGIDLMSDGKNDDAPQWRQTVEAFNKTMNELDSMRAQLRKGSAGPVAAATEEFQGVSHAGNAEPADSQNAPFRDPELPTVQQAQDPQIDKLERVLKVIHSVVGDREPSARERAALAKVDAELEALREEWRARQSSEE